MTFLSVMEAIGYLVGLFVLWAVFGLVLGVAFMRGARWED